VAQVTISVATKGDGEDKQFEWRDAETEHQLMTLTVSSSRATWIRSKTAAAARPLRSWKPRGVPTPIEPASMDQQPLEDVRMTAQMGTAHTSGVIEVRERAFDQFATPTHQTPSA
jgi:hypothetical protein